MQLEHRARAPKPFQEAPVRLVEVVDDAAVHRGRAPTVEEIQEAARELPSLPPIGPDEEREGEPMKEEKAKCGKCGAEKDLTEEFFYKSSCKSGFSTSKCKACRQTYEAAIQKERSRERAKKYVTLPAKKTVTAPAVETFVQELTVAAVDDGPQVDIQDVKELVDAHWKYVGNLLRTHGEGDAILRKIEFHYRTAMIHGYKHGLEATEIKMPSLVG